MSRRTYEGKWFRVVQESWPNYGQLDRTLDYYVLSDWRIGVPAKALSYDSYTHYDWGGGAMPISITRLLERAIPAPPGKQRFPLAFPAHPIWPAFIANTLFYATLLWLVIRASVVLRRLLRLRRDLCPKCAYPMGESEVCTECGKPLSKQAAA